MDKNATIESVRKVKANLSEIPTACGTIARKANVSFFSCKSCLIFLEEIGIAKKLNTSGGIKWIKARQET